MLPKWPPQSTPNFCGLKTLKLKSEIQILLSHSPRYGELHNFLWAQASYSSMGALMSLMSDFNERFTRLVITGIGEAACSSRYVLELGLDFMILLAISC